MNSGSKELVVGLMLRWAVIFLIVALVAALLGIGGLFTGAMGIAQILFYVLFGLTAVLFVIAIVVGARTTLP